MDESVYLIVKMFIFNVYIPVHHTRLTVPSELQWERKSLKLEDIPIYTQIEYLTEEGRISRERSAGEPRTVRIVNGKAARSEVIWEFGEESPEVTTAKKGIVPGKREGVGAAVDGGETEKEQYKNDRGPNPGNSKEAADMEGENKNGGGANTEKEFYWVSYPIYLLIKLIRMFGVLNLKVLFEYSEIDHIPLAMQLLFHVPLILTGVVIFMVIFTMEPEVSTDRIKEEISKLPLQPYALQLGLADCPVCLEPFAEGQPTRILKCTHGFHKECIDSWLLNSLKCPLCRSSVLNSLNTTQTEPYPIYYYI